MKTPILWLVILCSILGLTVGEVAEDNPIDKEGQKWLSSLFKLPEGPRIRKEYRLLTDEERERYHNAFIQLRNDTSVHPDKYTLLSSLHARRSTRNSAHKGPGFCGWHRILMLLMENALRQIYPDMTLPYWDTTLEAELDVPRDSVLFTERFMGNGNGFVINGPFNNWTVQRGDLYRTVGARYSPMDDHNISVILSQIHLGDISYPYADGRDENLTNYELVHNRVHNWVGGEMDKIETAADDPIFYIYHCFIDYVFEKFRANQREHGIDPVTDWPTYYGASRHNLYAPMGLGSLMAGDGNSEVFARNVIYLDKPSCSRTKPDCGTPYLWCNVTRERCTPWTRQEFEDMEYTANENQKPLLEEIATHIEYRIEQEMEKMKLSLENLPDGSGDNDTTNSTGTEGNDSHEYDDHGKFEQRGTDTALVGVEIAMVVLAACLGCYAAFLITIKCFLRSGENRPKDISSYNINGNQGLIPEHNMAKDDIIAEITRGDMVKEASGKEYKFQQERNAVLEAKLCQDISHDVDDRSTSERYVNPKDIEKVVENCPRAKKVDVEVSKITNSDYPLSEVDDKGVPLYENAFFRENTKNVSDIDSDKTRVKGAGIEVDRGSEKNKVDTADIDKLKSDADNICLSEGIFTRLGTEFVLKERL